MPDAQPEYLRVRTFERYQVYKDGRPTKFVAVWATTDAEHTGVLDNPDFLELADDPECPVFQLMVLAARMQNRIPNRPDWLRGILGCSRAINVEKLLSVGFLEPYLNGETPANKVVRDSTLIEVNRSEVKEANASVREVFNYWVEKRDRNPERTRLTDKRRKHINARLKDFSVEECKRTIDGVANDPWEGRSEHDDLTVIFRPENFEKFLALADTPLTTEERRAQHLLSLKERGVA